MPTVDDTAGKRGDGMVEANTHTHGADGERRLLLASEAAERYALPSARYVLDAARAGDLPAVRLSRKMVRFKPEDLDEWVERHRRDPRRPDR